MSKISAIMFTDHHNMDYILYYLSDKMSEKQALLEMEMRNMGGGDPSLFPYFIIVPTDKSPILSAIRDGIIETQYDESVSSIWRYDGE